MKILKYIENEIIEYDTVAGTSRAITERYVASLKSDVTRLLSTGVSREVDLTRIYPEVNDGLVYLRDGGDPKSVYIRKPKLAKLPIMDSSSTIEVPLPRIIVAIEDERMYLNMYDRDGHDLPIMLSNVYYDDSSEYIRAGGGHWNLYSVCTGDRLEIEISNGISADEALARFLSANSNYDLGVEGDVTLAQVLKLLRIKALAKEITVEQLKLFRDELSSLYDKYGKSNRYNSTLFHLSALYKSIGEVTYDFLNGTYITSDTRDLETDERMDAINSLIEQMEGML